jgi:L-lactate dehydrogenase (cytochrome)
LLRPQPRGGREQRLERAFSIPDLRLEAKRNLPRPIFDYIDGGGESEQTMRRNRAAFEEVELIQHVLRDVRQVDTARTILGCESSLPLALGPTGATGVLLRDGELKVARAAAAAGVPYAVSTSGTVHPEDVAQVTSAPLWYQVSVRGDKGWCQEIIGRARAAGCRALLLTVDNAITSWRLRDLRNRVTLPPVLDWRMLREGLRRLPWSWQFMQGDAVTIPNFEQSYVAGVPRPVNKPLTFDDLEWASEAWGGPVVIKGVSAVSDARRAVATGVVCGIVVSNHGGRQLDGARASLDCLPGIAEAVGDEVEVLVDGGVRSGVDVVRALCLGARACLIGRAYLYGLGAGGQAGVERALQLLRGELERTMALVGATSVSELGPDSIHVRGPAKTLAGGLAALP